MPIAKLHDGEPDIDVELAAALVADQFPEWAHLPLTPVASSGTDNVLYRLGPDLTVRLPRVDWAVADVAKDHRWLPALAPHLPVAIPEPLRQGTPGRGYPWSWSIQRWLGGTNPTVGAVPDPDGLARDLGRVVRALHAVPTDSGPLAGGPLAARGVALADRDAQTREAITACADHLDPGAATAEWEAALAAPPWDGPPVWLHGDLTAGNLLCTEGRLTAVIDFGALGIGEPACDLIPAWNLLPAPSRATFRTAAGADAATWRRGRGWALSIAVIALPYYVTSNPALAANSRHVLDQLLA